MALIEIHPILADHFPVADGVTIIEGMVVKLNSDGEVVVADSTSGEVALGIAADTKSTSTSGLPTTNDSSQGAFVNRVSDSFDETKASGRMTVYHSGGKFGTNQFVAGSYAVNDALYAGASGNAGLLTNVDPSATSQIIGYVTKVPGAYDSGVPGTDVNGSLSLGSYLEFKLAI